MDSNKKKEKNYEINTKFILKILVLFFIFTYVLAWAVSIPNSILGIFSIPNFETSNDWIGFGGYLLTSIIAIYVYFGTSKQTRDIQDRITRNEEDRILKNSRTSIEDTMISTNYNLSTNYRELLKGNRIIFTKDYMHLDNLLRYDDDVYTEVLDNINNKRCAVANVNQLNGLIDSLKEHERYIFRIIKNIGKSSMYNIKITFKGSWFMHGQVINSDSIEFRIKHLDSKECIVLPLFRINNNINLLQFNVSETIVEYDTGSFGLREKMSVTLKYNLEENCIHENIEIQEIKEDYLEYKYDFMHYTYIQS